MSLRVVRLQDKKKKKQKLFPPRLWDKIKPNLGILSTVSAPHDKICFCFCRQRWRLMASQHTQGCRHCYQAPAHAIPPIRPLVVPALSCHNGQLCASVQTRWIFSGDTRSWTGVLAHPPIPVTFPDAHMNQKKKACHLFCTHNIVHKNLVTLDKVLNLPQFPLLENGETNRVVRLSELYT